MKELNFKVGDKVKITGIEEGGNDPIGTITKIVTLCGDHYKVATGYFYNDNELELVEEVGGTHKSLDILPLFSIKELKDEIERREEEIERLTNGEK